MFDWLMQANVVNTTGRCIYCGASGEALSKEHVVPLGLSGEWTIANASCATCAQVTSAFEFEVLRVCLQAQRAALGFKSRRKKDTPASYPALIQGGAGVLVTSASAADYPPVLPMPLLSAVGANPAGVELLDIIYVNLEHASEKALALAAATVEPQTIGTGMERTVEVQALFRPLPFIRLIAKVAHGLAVAQYGLDAFDKLYLAPFIHGTEENVGKWLGSSTTNHTGIDALHTYTIEVINDEVVVYVRLFASFEGPEYTVVVGTLSANAA